MTLSEQADRLGAACEDVLHMQVVFELWSILAAIRQHAERGGWQPIEAAPKDRPILICWGLPALGPQGMHVGYWNARMGRWHDMRGEAIESDSAVALSWCELPTPPTKQAERPESDERERAGANETISDS